MVAGPNDLTTLAAAKAWIFGSATTSPPPTTNDIQIQAYVTQASIAILSYLQRGRILPHDVSEVRDGYGGNSIMLKQYPVLSMKSVSIPLAKSTAPLTAYVPGSAVSGYALEGWDGSPPGKMQKLTIVNGCIPRAPSALLVTYRAGYATLAEAATVSGAKATPQNPYGRWATDEGVTYANGTALVAVTASPAVGQYVAPTATNADYVFNAGDNGQDVLLNYGFIPADLERACYQWIGEQFDYQKRIGQRSKSLGGQETVSFNIVALPPDVKMILSNYMRMAPI